MRRRPRILYIGMVCTDAYVTATGEQAFVGAAAGKMSAVVSALRSAGRRAALVSLPFVGQGPTRQPSQICRGDGYPAFFLPTHRNALVRKAIGTLALGWFAVRRVRSGDRILFYNHAIEYTLALLVLRLRRIAVFQDIEDLPTNTDTGLRGLANKIGYWLMSRLSSPRKVTVSNQIGRNLGISDFLAVQGVANANVDDKVEEKWSDLEAGGALRIHFGGTLMVSTGLNSFCEALEYLNVNAACLKRDIFVIVTGIGDINRVETLAMGLDSQRLRVRVLPKIDRESYFRLLNSSHIGLSLKYPHAEFADTTFPSKVIEITSHGLALVSTRVSDVDELFAEDEAWLLPRPGGRELAEILLYMAAHPEEVRRRAQAGQCRARARFAPAAIGHALGSFLEAGPSSL